MTLARRDYDQLLFLRVMGLKIHEVYNAKQSALLQNSALTISAKHTNSFCCLDAVISASATGNLLSTSYPKRAQNLHWLKTGGHPAKFECFQLQLQMARHGWVFSVWL